MLCFRAAGRRGTTSIKGRDLEQMAEFWLAAHSLQENQSLGFVSLALGLAGDALMSAPQCNTRARSLSPSPCLPGSCSSGRPRVVGVVALLTSGREEHLLLLLLALDVAVVAAVGRLDSNKAQRRACHLSCVFSPPPLELPPKSPGRLVRRAKLIEFPGTQNFHRPQADGRTENH